MILRSRMTLKSSVVIFQALETSEASLTSAAFANSLASTTSKALFPQKTSWSWWFDHQWHQNDQYRSLFVELIIKNTNFHWDMVPFLLGGCWGQPMLLFWKLVDETQILKPQEYIDTFNQNLTCIFLSVSQFKISTLPWGTLQHSQSSPICPPDFATSVYPIQPGGQNKTDYDHYIRPSAGPAP